MAALPKNATEAQIIKFIGEHYGADIAAFLRIPELRRLIIKAATDPQGAWSPDLVSTQLRRTRWYRTRSESMRTIDALKVADPSEYKRLVASKQAEIIPLMQQLGLVGSKTLAETALRLGWNEEQIRADLGKRLEATSAQVGFRDSSTAAADASKLMAIAREEYLTPIDRQTAERWVIRAYQQGTDVEDQFRHYLGSISNARFGIQPDSGVSPSDMMAPVRMAIAESLELNPEQVDLLDPKYRDVMQIQTSDGKYRPMTASEATTWARSRDEFRGTKTAQNETADLVEQLGKTFGVIG